jgi:hypothetical protein
MGASDVRGVWANMIVNGLKQVNGALVALVGVLAPAGGSPALAVVGGLPDGGAHRMSERLTEGPCMVQCSSVRACWSRPRCS